MRVTQNMLAANSLRNLSASYSKLGKYMDQLSTGKKITKPSDDPVVAVKGMSYRSQLSEVDQYQRNLSELHLWMDNSEAGIGQANSALQRIRELVLQGSTGTVNDKDRQAIAAEVAQLKQDLVTTANTQVAGRYIFNGTNVMNPPVSNTEPPVVNLNTDDYNVDVSNGISLKANVNPANVFSQDLFDTVQHIQDALTTNNPTALNGYLGDLDNVMDKMYAERSDLGARSNRLDMVENRLSQQNIMATQVLSDNEDAQIEQVITDLTTQESVHRAALSMGAQIIQPTLMDFLK